MADNTLSKLTNKSFEKIKYEPSEQKETTSQDFIKAGSVTANDLNKLINFGVGAAEAPIKAVNYTGKVLENAKNKIENTPILGDISKAVDNFKTEHPIISGALSALTPATTLAKTATNAVTGLKDFNEKNKLEEKMDSYINENIQEVPGAASRKLTELAPSLGENAMSAIVGGAAGKAAGSALFGLSAAESYANEGKQKGMTDEQSLLYGAGGGAIEFGSEMISLGFLENGLNKLIKGQTKQFLINQGINMAEEYGQEAITEYAKELLADSINGSGNYQNMLSRMNEAGIDGALSALILQGASGGLVSCGNVLQKVASNEKVTTTDLTKAENDIKVAGNAAQEVENVEKTNTTKNYKAGNGSMLDEVNKLSGYIDSQNQNTQQLAETTTPYQIENEEYLQLVDKANNNRLQLTDEERQKLLQYELQRQNYANEQAKQQLQAAEAFENNYGNFNDNQITFETQPEAQPYLNPSQYNGQVNFNDTALANIIKKNAESKAAKAKASTEAKKTAQNKAVSKTTIDNSTNSNQNGLKIDLNASSKASNVANSPAISTENVTQSVPVEEALKQEKTTSEETKAKQISNGKTSGKYFKKIENHTEYFDTLDEYREFNKKLKEDETKSNEKETKKTIDGEDVKHFESPFKIENVNNVSEETKKNTIIAKDTAKASGEDIVARFKREHGRAYQALEKLGEKYGMNVEIDPSITDESDLGYYDSEKNTLVVNPNSTVADNVRVFATHETVHKLKEVAPNEYKALQKVVAEIYNDNDSEVVAKIREKYGERYKAEDIDEEIVANFCGQLFSDDLEVFDTMVQKNPSAVKRFIDRFVEIFKEIKQKLVGKKHYNYGTMTELLSGEDIDVMESKLKRCEARFNELLEAGKIPDGNYTIETLRQSTAEEKQALANEETANRISNDKIENDDLLHIREQVKAELDNDTDNVSYEATNRLFKYVKETYGNDDYDYAMAEAAFEEQIQKAKPSWFDKEDGEYYLKQEYEDRFDKILDEAMNYTEQTAGKTVIKESSQKKSALLTAQQNNTVTTWKNYANSLMSGLTSRTSRDKLFERAREAINQTMAEYTARNQYEEGFTDAEANEMKAEIEEAVWGNLKRNVLKVNPKEATSNDISKKAFAEFEKSKTKVAAITNSKKSEAKTETKVETKPETKIVTVTKEANTNELNYYDNIKRKIAQATASNKKLSNSKTNYWEKQNVDKLKMLFGDKTEVTIAGDAQKKLISELGSLVEKKTPTSYVLSDLGKNALNNNSKEKIAANNEYINKLKENLTKIIEPHANEIINSNNDVVNDKTLDSFKNKVAEFNKISDVKKIDNAFNKYYKNFKTIKYKNMKFDLEGSIEEDLIEKGYPGNAINYAHGLMQLFEKASEIEERNALTNANKKHMFKTANKTALAKIEKLKAQGYTESQIDKKTKTIEEPLTGKRLEEISDYDSELKVDEDFYQYEVFETTLGDILNHPELYDNYPELYDTKVVFDNLGSAINGAYNQKDKSIAISNSLNNDMVRSTLLHEIQHWIQDKEGLIAGSNIRKANWTTNALDNPYVRDAMNTYKEIAIENGEADENTWKDDTELLNKWLAYQQENFYKGLSKQDILKNLEMKRYENSYGEYIAREVQKRANNAKNKEMPNYFNYLNGDGNIDGVAIDSYDEIPEGIIDASKNKFKTDKVQFRYDEKNDVFKKLNIADSYKQTKSDEGFYSYDTQKEDGEYKQRKTANSIINSNNENVSRKVKNKVQDMTDNGVLDYRVIGNKELAAKGLENINNEIKDTDIDDKDAMNRAWKKATGGEYDADEAVATLIQVALNYDNMGETDLAADAYEDMAEIVTKSGRAVQYMNVFKAMTGESKYSWLNKTINKYNTAHQGKEIKWGKTEKDEARNTLKSIAGLRKKVTVDNKNEFNKNLKDLVVGQGFYNSKAGKKLAAQTMKVTDFSNDELLDMLEEETMQKYLRQGNVSVWKKINSYQVISHLLNTSTGSRNMIGNKAFSIAEKNSHLLAAGLEKIFYNTNSTLINFDKETEKRIKGDAKNEAGKIQSKILLGIDGMDGTKYTKATSRMDGMIPTFKSKTFNTLEKALGVELKVPDEKAKTDMRERIIQGYKNTLDEETYKANEKDILEYANQAALYATFQDETHLSKLMQSLKQTANNVLGTPEFGLGDFLVKYTQVPGNIIHRTIEYSPLGVAKGIYSMAVADNQYKKGQISLVKRNDAIIKLARGLNGTSLMALGYALRACGIITGDDDDDDNIKKLLKDAGISVGKLNTSSIGRLLTGNASSKTQDDDTLVSFDWMQPVSSIIKNGGAIYDGIHYGDVVSGIKEAVTMTLDLPCNQALSTIINEINYGSGDFGENALWGTATAIGDSISGFIPSPIRHIANAIDPTTRSVYSNTGEEGKDWFAQTGKKIVNSIPGLSKTLEPSINNQAEAKKYSDYGTFLNFLIQASPARVTKVNMSKELDKYEELPELSDGTESEEATKSLYPLRYAPNKTQYSSEDYEKGKVLNDKDKTQYMQAYASYYEQKVLPILQEYQKGSSDETKEDVIKQLKKAQTAAKKFAEDYAMKN